MDRRSPKNLSRALFLAEHRLLAVAVAAIGVLFANPAVAASTTGVHSPQPIYLCGIPIDFILFGLTLLGVAVFHRHTLPIAVAGLAVIVTYKLLVTGFHTGAGITGLALHLQHEWVVLANLFLLLIGFAILSRHFEESGIPDVMPAILPDDWRGCLMLLAIVFVLSGFLDNIASALIGGTVARHVFRNRVHIGYLAAIVAAANAGGAGSVLGDTTTTMMWIAGISPLKLLDAYLPAIVAFAVFAVPASFVQHKYSSIIKDMKSAPAIDWVRLLTVASILIAALAASGTRSFADVAFLDAVPVLGIAIWLIILVFAGIRSPDWSAMPEALKGTVFLVALVTAASLMPVENLPEASWHSTLGLGFVSAVFDNIPLTAIALRQGGYDWGFLAYAVGFGGSMVWFGSSAGVALSNMYPEAKSVGHWLRHGWTIPIAYVVGFFALLLMTGWHPDPALGQSSP
jgi:Na+/H+ antiporter NhaD/arsenite permease-like protein